MIGLSPRLRSRSWRLRRSYGFVLQPPVIIGLRRIGFCISAPVLPESRSRRSYRFVLQSPACADSREKASFSISAPAPTSEWVCAAASRARGSPMATLAARSLHAGRPAASTAVLSTMISYCQLISQAKTFLSYGHPHRPVQGVFQRPSRAIFYQGLVLSRPASFNGHSVNNVATMAVLSARSGQMGRSPHSGFAWPISYCPV